MNYLIDTHTFLWFGTDDSQLPETVRQIIEDEDNSISLCIASLWEIGIKNSLGKLPLPNGILGLEREAHELAITILPITVTAINQITMMPPHHKDPFDRIIAATALTQGQTLLSADTIFDSYGVARIWGTLN